MRRSVIPFELRDLPGEIHVALEANEYPTRLGCGLLTGEVPAAAAIGFPVCTATIRYDLDGYAAMLGWIQLVRCTDGVQSGASFELDPLALFRDVEMPYAFFGVKPTLFDAPFRAARADLIWQAHSFLCFSPDAIMGKRVHAVAGFGWGFWLQDGHFFFHGPTALTPDDWNLHLPLLSTTYSRWQFRPGFRSA